MSSWVTVYTKTAALLLALCCCWYLCVCCRTSASSLIAPVRKAPPCVVGSWTAAVVSLCVLVHMHDKVEGFTMSSCDSDADAGARLTAPYWKGRVKLWGGMLLDFLVLRKTQCKIAPSSWTKFLTKKRTFHDQIPPGIPRLLRLILDMRWGHLTARKPFCKYYTVLSEENLAYIIVLALNTCSVAVVLQWCGGQMKEHKWQKRWYKDHTMPKQENGCVWYPRASPSSGHLRAQCSFSYSGHRFGLKIPVFS